MTSSPDISRRDLLRGRLRRDPPAGPTPARAMIRYLRPDATRTPVRRPGTIPLLRPPGAVDEATFLAECTRCNACLEACPHDAIVHAPARFRSAAGTPMIDPMREPCWQCDDAPCIPACEPDVLSAAVPRVMGTARIDVQSCLAHRGTFCTVCSERCPEPGAIALTDGRPRIDESVCTGCGVCQHVCPAPQNAVAIMPAFTRPGRPAADGADA